MASSGRPEHQAPPEIVCYWLSRDIINIVLMKFLGIIHLQSKNLVNCVFIECKLLWFCKPCLACCDSYGHRFVYMVKWLQSQRVWVGTLLGSGL